MSRLARFTLVLCLATTGLLPAWAKEDIPAATVRAEVVGSASVATLPAAPQLIPFASEEGMARLARATAKADFPSLANQFEAQSNAAFCGPTSTAIVLNALFYQTPQLPRDRSRLRPEDTQYAPQGFDLSVPRFTQDNVIGKAQGPYAKTRAQVLGEPVVINGNSTRDDGYQLRQLNEMLRANGALTRLVVVDDTLPEATIRQDLIENLQRSGDYVLVNYRRKEAGQRGGGHISPLGAYDAASDSFLLMDVNPAAAGWVWMPTANLIQGMRTRDVLENRGYVLILGR